MMEPDCCPRRLIPFPQRERQMAKRIVLGLALAALVFLGGWAVAQQPGQAIGINKSANVSAPHGAPTQGKDSKEGGHFTVSPAGNTAVLVDTATGKTWVLRHSFDKSRPSV